MKSLIYILLIVSCLIGCNAAKTIPSNKQELNSNVANDTVVIANDSLEYQIIIIEPGFNSWLASYSKPRGYYSQDYLENRNHIYVTAWNNRVLQPQTYNRNLFQMSIDYQRNIDYGYEVNYLLYNYFIYFQLTYKQQLAGFVPRI